MLEPEQLGRAPEQGVPMPGGKMAPQQTSMTTASRGADPRQVVGFAISVPCCLTYHSRLCSSLTSS